MLKGLQMAERIIIKEILMPCYVPANTYQKEIKI